MVFATRSAVTAGIAPALPDRAASWWYVGQIAAGCAAAVALLGAAEVADDDAGAALEAAAGVDTPCGGVALEAGGELPAADGCGLLVHAVASSRQARAVGNIRLGLIPQVLLMRAAPTCPVQHAVDRVLSRTGLSTRAVT
jgi:hypothetical protein